MDCITEINNTQVDNAKDLDVVMPMYNLIEYSDNYSKTPRTLYHICRDVTHPSITDSESFKFKSRFLDNTNNADIINAEIAVSLKYLSNFWRTIEIPLINCEDNLILTWSEKCVISKGNWDTTFKITDTKLNVLVVTFSTQDNLKLLQKLISALERTTN